MAPPGLALPARRRYGRPAARVSGRSGRRAGRLLLRSVCLERFKRGPRRGSLPDQAAQRDHRQAGDLRALPLISLPTANMRMVQAAAWHVNNGLDWNQMLQRGTMGPFSDPARFTQFELLGAQRLTLLAEQAARQRASSEAGGDASSSPPSRRTASSSNLWLCRSGILPLHARVELHAERTVYTIPPGYSQKFVEDRSWVVGSAAAGASATPDTAWSRACTSLAQPVTVGSCITRPGSPLRWPGRPIRRRLT